MKFADTLLIQDCDYEKVLNERLKNSSFYKNYLDKDFRIVEFMDFDTEDELQKVISPTPFVPQDTNKKFRHLEEIMEMQSSGLARRMLHINSKTALIGLSGGLDSTLALLVIIEAFRKLNYPIDGIIAVTMPGFGTTKRTKSNAVRLANLLNMDIREISIENSTRAHFVDIGHDENHADIVFENAQARRRTHILMDLANKYGGIVVGTGDLSEIALGWSTFNADHISMYNVNASVPKTLVKSLIQWYADTHFDLAVKEVLYDIIDTPISPELLPNSGMENVTQITENIIGPYILHDFFLYYTVRHSFRPKKVFLLASIAFRQKYSPWEIISTLRIFYQRFFANQFKRSVFADGVKIGTVSLSPRGDWRMPSDADVSYFLTELSEIII